MNLSGVLVPAVTPFDPQTGEVDLVALRANVRSWLAHPVRGVVLAGSTGEAVFLDDAERVAMIEAVREVVPDDRRLLAGTGLESTRATIRLTRAAAAAGADAVLIQPPAFFKPAMTPEVLRDHYLAVADASPVPVVIYQVPPRFSTVELSSGLVAELSRHPNLIGVKDSRGDLEGIGELVRVCRPGFQILSGSGLGFFAALEVGAVGGILGVANPAARLACSVFDLQAAGHAEAAGRAQEALDPIHREIVAGLGIPGVKASVDLVGMHGGAPRSPLRPLAPERRAQVRAALVHAGIVS